MPGSIFSSADFLAALQALLPRGKAWPRDPDAVQTEVADALSPTYARQSAASNGLLLDSPPFQLDQMLPEWEATLGLPDPCAGEAQSHAQRVSQVLAKLSGPGGQSVAYFIQLAALLGYANCTITTYAPFRCGRSDCGDPLGGVGWFFVWLLNAPDLPVTYFQCGQSTCGDPLYALGGDELRCTINRYAPAHTVVLYSGNA